MVIINVLNHLILMLNSVNNVTSIYLVIYANILT